MKQKELFKLLDEVQEKEDIPVAKRHDKVLLIDGLNLFFRNFAMLNMVNPDGVHIGGLGGFLRSLGALIRQISPTAVYVVFDGEGSSINRKNINADYKADRNLQRITNWEVFEDVSDEHDSKVDQLVRLVQYIKCLPVKILSIDKVEADDIIAVLSKQLVKEYNSKVFIVSNDQDFIQLASDDVIIYRPIPKDFFNADEVKNKYKVLAENFIIYKTLLGDMSDKIRGIKGLGEKGIHKKFPELGQRKITLDEVFEIAESKFKDHVVYARIVQDKDRLRDNYKIMDLANPLVNEAGYKYITSVVNSSLPELNKSTFANLYEDDKLGGMIRHLDIWLVDCFEHFKNYKD